MVAILCRFCESEKLTKDGRSLGGKQRYLCHACNRTSVLSPNTGTAPEQEQRVLALLNERMSLRGIARALKMSRVTVVQILKKKMT